MTGAQTDRLTATLQNYSFSCRGHNWELYVYGRQERQGERFLHVALVGDPPVTLTVHMPRDCNVRMAAERIGDRIVDWLAAADWRQHGFIDLPAGAPVSE